MFLPRLTPSCFRFGSADSEASDKEDEPTSPEEWVDRQQEDFVDSLIFADAEVPIHEESSFHASEGDESSDDKFPPVAPLSLHSSSSLAGRHSSAKDKTTPLKTAKATTKAKGRDLQIADYDDFDKSVIIPASSKSSKKIKRYAFSLVIPRGGRKWGFRAYYSPNLALRKLGGHKVKDEEEILLIADEFGSPVPIVKSRSTLSLSKR